MKLILPLLALAFTLTLAYRPLQPQKHRQIPAQGDVGEPLFLTPYLQSGDIATAKQLAKVVDPLPGVESANLENYAGFFTVKESTNSNIFFWFFPATDVPAEDAPVVIWLQGGPGSSSLFGLLELHGPIIARFDGNGDTTGTLNEFTWNRKAHMLYIDNPVGAGYSFSDPDGLPTSQADAGTDLYECLIQFYTLFPELQPNDFYAFGESYAGKWVPTIARKIHDENPSAQIKINLKGIGIGDGFMSPPETAVYAKYLYQLSLIDEIVRDELLDMEKQMQEQAANGQWPEAWSTWNNELGYAESQMGCFDIYDIHLCNTDPEEDNYEVYCQRDETRKAIHVGDRPFGSQSGDVYSSMIGDFMRPQREDVEFLLDLYQVLIYNGNFDVICNHSGILDMFAAMNTWSAIDEYYATEREVFRVNGDVAGYLKSVQNLRMIMMRNSSHMVPMSQPPYAQDMFERFIAGTL